MLFLGFVVGALLVVLTVPRLLNLVIKPDRVYPLYGFHYSVHRAIGRLTNVKFFTYLFGDSSYIVHYLRALGYDLSIVEQTGSNFGTDVRHETPFHVSVGRGTMVADGLSIINADFSNTSFRVSRVSIGAHSFLGNRIAYPARSRIGENCLLATKVLIPTDGPLRRDVGLLGAPSFPIPRTVDRDGQLGPRSAATLRRRLRAKNRYNRRTIALALLVRWLYVLGLTLLGMSAADFYQMIGVGAVAAELGLATLFTAAYFVLVERAAVRFRALRPRFCSIYHPYFWWHERFWKLIIPPFDRMLAGTPFKNLVSRLLGVRIGRRVFDDGLLMTERTLVDIGDHCTLNAEAVIQCHSQEDGHFKSDRTTIGAGCTLGVAAFVHYGVNLGDGAVLDSGSFLMKGEEVPPRTQWGGNPAWESQDAVPGGSDAGLLTAPVSPAAARPRRRIRPVRAAAALVALALLPAGVAVASGLSTADTGEATSPSTPLPTASETAAPVAGQPAAVVLVSQPSEPVGLRRGRRRSRRSWTPTPPPIPRTRPATTRKPLSSNPLPWRRRPLSPRPPQPSEPWRTRRRRPGRRRQLLFGRRRPRRPSAGAGTEAGGDEGRDVAMSTGVMPAEDDIAGGPDLLEGRTCRRGVHRSTALDPPPCLRLR